VVSWLALLSGERCWAAYATRKNGERAMAVFQTADGVNHCPVGHHPEWLLTRAEAEAAAADVAAERKIRRNEKGAALIAGAPLADGNHLGFLNIWCAYEEGSTAPYPLRDEAVHALLTLDTAAEDVGDSITAYFKYAPSEQARLAAVRYRPRRRWIHPDLRRFQNYRPPRDLHFAPMITKGVTWWTGSGSPLVPADWTALREVTAAELAEALGVKLPADAVEEPQGAAQLPLFPDMAPVTKPKRRRSRQIQAAPAGAPA
jgi:hypothetical protein